MERIDFNWSLSGTRTNRDVADRGVAGVGTPALLKNAGVDPHKLGYFGIFFSKRIQFCIFLYFQNEVVEIRG